MRRGSASSGTPAGMSCQRRWPTRRRVARACKRRQMEAEHQAAKDGTGQRYDVSDRYAREPRPDLPATSSTSTPGSATQSYEE